MVQLVRRDFFNYFNRLLNQPLTNRVRQLTTAGENKPFQDIPGPKPLPLIGNIWRYFPIIGQYKVDTMLENAQYNRKRYGPIVREQLTSQHTILHLFDPSDIETFFRQDSEHPHRRSHRALLKYRRERPDLYKDGGLFPENGLNWYRQRKLFNRHLMSKSKLANLIDDLDNMSLRIVNMLNDKIFNEDDQVEIHKFDQILFKLALGHTLSTFLNVDIDDYDKTFINKMIQQLHNSLTAIERTEIYTDKWITKPDSCPHYRMLIESQEFLHSFVTQVVESLLCNEVNVTSDNLSLIQEWLLKDKIDKLDVVSFVIDSLMAGLHTTSYTVAFLLYHIARNPQIQEQLQTEVDTCLSQTGSINIENLDSMKLMRNCLKETLRLNPVSIGTGRVTCSEMTIRNYTIPQGTMVITQNQVISRNENIFHMADKFIPERWSFYRSCPISERPSPFASRPFGFGPRSCLGQRLVELQIKLFTGRLLQKFSLTPNHCEIPTKTTIIHVIADHYKVTLRKR